MKTIIANGRSIKTPDVVVDEENEREVNSLLEEYLDKNINVGLLRREKTGLAYFEGIITRLADSKIGICYHDIFSSTTREVPFQRGDKIYLAREYKLLPGQALPIGPHTSFVY